MDGQPDAGTLKGLTTAGHSGGAFVCIGEMDLVGRGAELGSVAAALDDVAAGTARVLGLFGEAGIGKTRLAEEATVLAIERGFVVLSGRVQSREMSVAYAPVLEALGNYLRSLDVVARATRTSGLPELGMLFGSLVAGRPEPLSDPALEQARLFEAVARLVERVQEHAPVLLFVDDAHEADAASLALLGYICRRLDRQRVLTLLTYRSDTDSLRPLRDLHASLRRQGLLQEVALAPLSRRTLAELTAARLGGPASEALLDLLDARAGGVPLFAETVLADLRDAGQLTRAGSRWTLAPGAVPDVPALARDVILRPLDRLAAADRRLADILAVAGDAVAHDRLAALAATDDGALLAGIGRLRAAGLVDEVVAGGRVSYRLHHPLIAEVAYAELGEAARRLLHAAFTAALERDEPVDLQRLARHYRGAGHVADTERACEVMTAAGEQALAVHANREAVALLSAALELRRATGSMQQVGGVLEQLGDALERIGEHAAAAQIWEEALQAATRAGDAPGAGRLHRRLAAAEWERGRVAQARDHLRRGRQVLATRGPSRELADLRLTEVWLLGWMDDLDAAAGAAAELTDLASRLGSTVVTAEALLAQARARLVETKVAIALNTACRALDAAEAAGDPLLLWRAHDINAACLIWDGDHHAMRHHTAAALELARDLAVPTLEMRSSALMALADFFAGDWDAASIQAAAVEERRRFVDQPRAVVQAAAVVALLHSYRGDVAAAQRILSEAVASYGRLEHDPSVQSFLVPAQIQLELSRDRVQAAVELADQALTRREGAWGGWLLVAGADAYLRRGRFESALALAPRIAGMATSDRALMAAEALRVEGAARAGLGEPDRALACLDTAWGLFCALDSPLFAARARLDWGRVRGGPEGEAAVRESYEVFERLGARPYADQARSALRALGVTPPRRLVTGPLSPREREVACLAAQGLTATQIAERLVISPHTARTHIKRIHVRLEVSSRAELTRYVVDAGWLADTPS
jgi:DNA-binding CsgD family transcriptional regulator/tetratricopeptide (TPR) repeat protein